MASTIDPKLALQLINEYRNQNVADGGPGLKTEDNHFLNGYFIDRESLEEILSHPDVTGVSIDIAKHPDFVGSPKNVFTLVYVGAKPRHHHEGDHDGQPPLVPVGSTYCGPPPPCPPWCVKLKS